MTAYLELLDKDRKEVAGLWREASRVGRALYRMRDEIEERYGRGDDTVDVRALFDDGGSKVDDLLTTLGKIENDLDWEILHPVSSQRVHGARPARRCACAPKSRR